MQTERTIWRKPRRRELKRKAQSSGYSEKNGFNNRIKNSTCDSYHPFRFKQIRDKCNELGNLIPPSLQKKNLFDQMEPATSFLEAAMDFPLEEDSKIALNSLQDTVYNGDFNSSGCTSFNQSPAITDAGPFAISADHGRNEDYNILKPLAEEMTTLPPAPKPIILNPKELYDIVNLQNEDRLPWKKLSKSNKTNYYRASGMLKKDYIRKYKSYLNSLSSEQLYRHRAETVLQDLVK